jgi:hypothetical protein
LGGACAGPAAICTGSTAGRQIVDLVAGDDEKTGERAVADNIRFGRSRIEVASPGRHVVKLWVVDPNVVFQRLVLVRGPLPASYLGPPESPRR